MQNSGGDIQYESLCSITTLTLAKYLCKLFCHFIKKTNIIGINLKERGLTLN